MILIADRRPEVRAAWRAALEDDGRRVVEAESRAAALAAIEAGGVGLLVTGELGELAGAELAVQAYEPAPGLPVVIVAWSAYPIGILNGVAVLLEPVTGAELAATVRCLG